MISSPISQTLNLNDQSDPVGKLRVSEPQSLIDTDFEYSLQGTKWETLELVCNYPSVFFRSNEPLYSGSQVTSLVGSVNQGSVAGGTRSQPNGTMRMTVATPPPNAFKVGDPITVKNSGTFFGSFNDTTDTSGTILAVINSTTIEYKSNSNQQISTSTQYTNSDIVVYSGNYFNQSRLPVATMSTIVNTPCCFVTFSQAHGLKPGTQIILVDPLSSNSPFYLGGVNNWTGGYPWIGSFQVDQVLSNSSILFQTLSTFSSVPLTITLSPTFSAFVNPTGYVLHRYLDGGVQLTPSLTFNTLATVGSGSVAPDAKIIRQTRKYFRYQSGKGIQFATGILFRPVYDIQTISPTFIIESSTLSFIVSLTMEVDPGVVGDFNIRYRPGTLVRVSGLTQASVEYSDPVLGTVTYPFSGDFRVWRVLDNTVYLRPQGINATRAFTGNFPTLISLQNRGAAKLEILEWHDATVRTGLFDEQNGAFFEYNGTYFSVVRRFSTQRLGRGIATRGSNIYFQVGGNPAGVVPPNTNLVLRGQSVRVLPFPIGSSNGTRTFAPAYRGDTNQSATAAIVQEERFRQDQFNLDKLDGKGPSGYVLNLNRMQMVYIDYSWYGAGKIRYGIRNNDGNIIWFHEIKNNNVNTEAYFRSGNLPARFELSTECSQAILQGISSPAGTITFTSTNPSNTNLTNFTTFTPLFLSAFTTELDVWPVSGKLLVGNEMMAYVKTKKNATTNLTEISAGIRGITPGDLSPVGGTQAASELFGATNTVELGSTVLLGYNQNCAPSLNHWGTAVLMDGRFDTDTSYLFTAASLSAITIPAGSEAPIVSIRLAPSVDNGVPGFLGQRALINRSALTLDSVGVGVIGQCQAILRLNPQGEYFTNRLLWQPVGAGSLSQYIDHSTRGNTPGISGGDIIGAFYADEGVGRFSTTTKQIDKIRDLGNGIIGGEGVYPDGPDILTVYLRNISTTTPASGIARLSWTEAQG